MISLLEALHLGTLPTRVSLYFGTMQILVDSHDEASDEQREFLLRRLHKAQEKMPEAIAEVEQTERLLLAIPVPAPPRPKMPADAVVWQKELFSRVQGALALEAPAQATCHMLGIATGEAWAALQLGGVVLTLLQVMPASQRLRGLLQALGEEQERTFKQLVNAMAHPLWTQPQRDVLTVVRSALGQAPSLSAGSSDVTDAAAGKEKLAALTATMKSLAQALDDLQESLDA